MADFKASEARRQEESGELGEATALDWIADPANAGNLTRDAGAVRCGKKGTVAIVEATDAYADALAHAESSGAFARACGPLGAIVDAHRRGAGAVVLRNLPLGGGSDDALAAARTAALGSALGVVLPCDYGGSDAVAAPLAAQPLGDDGPTPDCAIDLVLIGCGRPAPRKDAVTVATVEALVRAVSGDACATLRRPVSYACDGRRWDPRWGPSATGAAPCLDTDANLRTTLRFSAALKANSEWCDEASADGVDALAEIESALADIAFPFDLRGGDVLVLDARRWFFAYAGAGVPPGLAWFRGAWMPRAAIRNATADPPTDAHLVKAWVSTAARRPPSRPRP